MGQLGYGQVVTRAGAEKDEDPSDSFWKGGGARGWSQFHPCSGGAYFRFGDGVGGAAGGGQGDAVTLYGRF